MTADKVWTSANYCGCCGDTADTRDGDWCSRCLPHIRADGPPWERTFYAQHRRDCPFQVGGCDDTFTVARVRALVTEHPDTQVPIVALDDLRRALGDQ